MSITFDDGGSTEYSLAYPILERYGMKATFYVIPAAIGANAGFMTIPQLKDLVAHGHEIGSHTFNHLDLTTLSDAQVLDELSRSQAWIVQHVGVPDVTSFASPYGRTDERVRAAIANFYTSHRSVDPGLNFRDSSPYMLLAYGDSYAKWYVDQAKNERSWLIIVLHNLTENPNDTTATQVSDFVALLDQIKASGMPVLPVDQARALMSTPVPPPPPPPAPALALTSLRPKFGPISGGTSVTLTGTGFDPGATVTFGTTGARVDAVTSTSIRVTTPPRPAGLVAVTVRNPNGQSVTLPDAFRYRR